MKKLLTILLLLVLTGCSLNPPFGAGLTIDEKISALVIDEKLKSDISKLSTPEKELVEPLIKEEIKSITIDGIYKQVMITTESVSGIKYWVDEYVAPMGKGYQIWLQKPDGSSKSFGEGVLSNDLSFDWTAPSTSTIKVIK